MFSTHIPKHFWGEAVLTATYLINRMPSIVLKFKTPCRSRLQIFPYTKIISSLDLKIFECSAFVHIHQQHRRKIDPKSIKCIFIAYSSHQKGYKCYSPITKRVYNSMDVTFFEHQAYYHKTDMQGENMKAFQFWETLDLGDTVPLPPLTSQPIVSQQPEVINQIPVQISVLEQPKPESHLPTT